MSDGEDRDLPSRNVDAFRRLIDELRGTDVDVLVIVRGSFRLYLRREPGEQLQVADAVPAPETARPGVGVSAPLTGVFYLRPTPEQGPFAAPGDWVEVGQVVALIETGATASTLLRNCPQCGDLCPTERYCSEGGHAIDPIPGMSQATAEMARTSSPHPPDSAPPAGAPPAIAQSRSWC